MKINLGENLRRLRLKSDLTQEQLAQIFNVSPQAISRWENGSTYPDITMLPYIANYYNVSLDELIGMEEIRNTININELFPNVHQYRSLGQLDKAISILRDAMKIYPNNNGILAELALTLTLKCNNEPNTDWIKEAILLSERVLNNSTSSKLRSCVMANLCFLYLKLNETEKAKNLAKNLPHIWECRELLLAEMFDDGEYAVELRKAILKILSVIYQKIINSPKRKYSNPDDIIAEGVNFDLDSDISNKIELITKFLES